MIEGLFIVIEGVDGAGTTTQTRMLTEALGARGLPVHPTREPSDGPLGMMLRQILSNRIVVPGFHGSRPPSWSTMALLFAADRQDHLEAEIMPNLMDGVTVVCDRYYYSSVGYQSLSAGGAPETIAWVKEMNRHARRPDLTIVLDLPAAIAASRRAGRSGSAELYEGDELQEKLAVFYREVDAHFPDDEIVHVDSEQELEAVAAEIMLHVRRVRGES
ncbi:MAG: dTMP kinase [Myxococcales bacterium]|nr:dTMP kinase [Myxococcales bacterium]